MHPETKDKQLDSVSIIPIPTEVVLGEGVFQISQSCRIWVSPDAMNVGLLFSELLFLPLPVEYIASNTIPQGDILLISGVDNPVLGSDGYSLSITPGIVVIRANHSRGLFYAIQTFWQLAIQGGNEIRAMEIIDKPRFPWRGIMLDVGRHLFPLAFIKRLIDVMAICKLNVLHWHLTEDQGWRIEIKKYPKLTEIGSQRSASPISSERDKLDGVPYGGYYSQEEIREIVSYAASRYITVVPEIEMPGHSCAALAAYPELGCTGGPYQVRSFWGIEKDVYCAGNENVYTFLKDVLDEVFVLFPSEFIHVGGDECPKDRWVQCPKCQNIILRNGLKDEHELQSYFIQRMERYINSKGRRLIGWDEILEGGLAPNASVMSWRGVEGGIQAVKQGHDVVMTPNSHCYFDYYQSEERLKEPPAIGGYLPLETVFAYEPIPPECTLEEAKHILGVQGNLWTEYISTPEQAEYMLFPRAVALAEIGWSKQEARDFGNFQQRLTRFLPILHKLGVNYRHP